MDPISVEGNSGKVINIEKEDSEQSIEQTFAADNNESMQKSCVESDSEVNTGVKMGSSESACEKEDGNSEENSFADCESNFSNSESTFSATAEEESGEKEGVKCEAINETLVADSNSLTSEESEADVTVVDGRDRRKQSVGHDFEMELIIKSLTASRQREIAPAKTEKRTETVAAAALEFSDEEDDEENVESSMKNAVCRWSNCGVTTASYEIVLHEKSCDKKLCICKWLSCNREVTAQQLDEHEANCGHRLSSCTWWNCDVELPLEEIGDHVEKCGKSVLKCKWIGCGQEAERNCLGNVSSLNKFKIYELVQKDIDYL